jgi:hypothetical protein
MSDIRRTHPGYFRVTLGLALTWYISLGAGSVIFHAEASRSATNKLVEAYVPLLAWGFIYLALGVALLAAITVRRVPHVVVRVCTGTGLVLSCFWLTTFVISALEGRLHLVSVIPAWATLCLVEWAALNEPERVARLRSDARHIAELETRCAYLEAELLRQRSS